MGEDGKEVRKDRNEEQLLSTFTVVTVTVTGYRSSETTSILRFRWRFFRNIILILIIGECAQNEGVASESVAFTGPWSRLTSLSKRKKD